MTTELLVVGAGEGEPGPGYMVTTENQHLFSAADVQAWQDTVELYQEQDVDENESGVQDVLESVRRPAAGLWTRHERGRGQT